MIPETAAAIKIEIMVVLPSAIACSNDNCGMFCGRELESDGFGRKRGAHGAGRGFRAVAAKEQVIERDFAWARESDPE
jgi:hypothetical protein